MLSGAFGGAMIGGAVGGLLAVLLPNYYRSVFEGPIDPLQTVLGLGISQGLVAGGVIGMAVLGLLIWREVRLREIESKQIGYYPRPNA